MDAPAADLEAGAGSAAAAAMVPPSDLYPGTMPLRQPHLPRIDEVFQAQTLVEPWTLATFLDFLEAGHSAENLRFYEEVEALKAHKKVPQAVDPPQDMLLLSKDMLRSNEGAWLDQLIKTYIIENALNQINISSAQREALLRRANALIPEGRADPDILLDAQHEVKTMMSQDAWPRFVESALRTNISTSTSQSRSYKGVGLFLLSLTLLGLFLGLFVPRYFFFLLELPWFGTFYYTLTSRSQQCYLGVLARGHCQLMPSDGGKCALKNAQCPIVKASQRKHALRGLLAVVAGSLFCTLVGFALTFAIERGQGVVLY